MEQDDKIPASFLNAIGIVIQVHEGGFQKRSDDPGNWTPDGRLVGTKFGIAAKSFPNEDIPNLTLQRAESLYWQVWGKFVEIQDQRILTKVLDLAVNTQWGGHGPATRMLQRAINSLAPPDHSVIVDGIFGQATADSCNACLTPKGLVGAICNEALSYYKGVEASHPGMHGWFHNWEQRAVWLPPEIV